MEQWGKIAIVLSVFGFLKDFRPSDPFVVQFLNGSWHNISAEQINQQVFPVGTYSYGIQLVITFLITDYFRYKPLIILSGLAGVGYWGLFVWTKDLPWLQLAEVFYGTYKSADVAFWSYIYARVDRSCYQKITSYTKSSSQLGKFVGAVGAQVLLFYGLVDYLDLNYVSLAVQLCTTAFALFLPAAPKSIYFNRSTKPIPSENNNVPADPTPPPVPLPITDDKAIAKLTALELLWFHAKSAYSNFTVLRFSIWYAVASCIYYQTVLYVQVLWKTISNRATTDVIHWNGAVEAVLTISGAAITFFAGFVPAKLLHVPNALLGLSMISFMQGGVLLISGLTRNLWVAYGAHIGYCILHAFTITLLSSEIAKNICRDSFGLVFGINAMIGSVLQCLLTVVVVHCSTIKGQFVVYAGVCAGMGVLYCVFLLVELKKWWKIVFYMIKTKFSPQKKIDLDGNKNHQII
ncbi:thiamine transporter 1-like [Aedes albopictus]|uniref:Micronutrient transporter folate transporter family n=1 Tax=Aedes albopictus TaxID=7160 RepID=A0ABM1Y6F2_AEDAL